jgi:hypothetical protein
MKIRKQPTILSGGQDMGIDNWDVAIFLFAGYLAVLALVRLMNRRRDQIVQEYQRQIEEEQERLRKLEEERQKMAA